MIQKLDLNQVLPAKLRARILQMAFAGNSVHIGCAFSLVEIIAALFTSTLRTDPNDPASVESDKLILSKGHGVMAIYAAHRELNWLSDDNLNSYFSDGSLLHGLSEAKTPGLEVSSGSLGHGLPIAAGMAFAYKKREPQSPKRVYCIVGDGEMNEGPMWEALLFAAHHKLDNLTVVVDANDFQAMGRIEAVLGMEPFVDKFKAFGFETSEVDGHDVPKLQAVFTSNASKTTGRPFAVIARTIKGRGISFMEANNDWHYRRLTPELKAQALAELEQTENGSSR